MNTNICAVNGEYSIPFCQSSLQPKENQKPLLEVNEFQWTEEFTISLIYKDGDEDQVIYNSDANSRRKGPQKSNAELRFYRESQVPTKNQ